MATDFSKIHPPALRQFFLNGMAHIKANQGQFAICAGDAEFSAWADYFERVVGATPYHFKRCRADPNLSFTAPTQWPQWFDAQAVADSPPLSPEPPRSRLSIVKRTDERRGVMHINW